MSIRVLIMVVAPAWFVGSGQAAAAESASLVVDDDGKQCAQADFASIQAAVDAATPDSRIRVFPGLYADSVRSTRR